MKTILAKTFTPSYDPVEDRIRLAINYEDAHDRADFMITRNFILDLIPSMQEYILSKYPNQEHDSSLNQDTQTASDKKEEVVSPTNSVNFELYRKDEELLREVNLSFDANTQITTLTLSSANITAQAKLDFTLLTQITDIINSAIPNIKWGISHHF